MFYYDNKKKSWVIGKDKNFKKSVIDLPKSEHPEGALYIPWIDLSPNQCQWSLGDWGDEPSNTFLCCGLQVAGGKKRGQRFCSYHVKISKGDK